MSTRKGHTVLVHLISSERDETTETTVAIIAKGMSVGSRQEMTTE
jgi:hypothetical protein